MGVYNEASCVINVWNSKVNSTDPASLSWSLDSNIGGTDINKIKIEESIGE